MNLCQFFYIRIFAPEGGKKSNLYILVKKLDMRMYIGYIIYTFKTGGRMSDGNGIKWDLSKPAIDKSLVESNLEKLQNMTASDKITKELVWQALYLSKIAQQNYEKGGHWAVETLDLVRLDKMGEIEQGCFAWFIVHPMNPKGTLRKAVRLMASDFIMFEEYARDIQAEAF